MLKNFLKGMGRASAIPRAEDQSALYQSLFEYLIGCISAPANAQQLIQLGYKAAKKDADEVFHAYLLFEKYLTSFELSERLTRRPLREGIRQRFPALLNGDSIFNILFVSETVQKNTLAMEFLQSFLDAVRDKFGRAGDGYFEKKARELGVLEEQMSDPDIFRKLQFLSFDAFQFVSSNYGDTLAGKIFEKTYETFSTRYKELEAFPHMLTLIPKEIVDRE
ncbi:MAG TPA: hypothetical protein VG101_18695, partial [Puia sp.]|nr:hypothetical protein [Puia sp.]